MAAPSHPTYLDLTRPIPPKLNLANVAARAPGVPCEFCMVIVPDRSKAHNRLIPTSYERIDVFPHFPGLKRTAKQGCTLCRVFRLAIQTEWGYRTMDEWGYGPLSVDDETWSRPHLFSMPWDGEVRIHHVGFLMAPVHVPTTGAASSKVESRKATCNARTYMVVDLSLEFGPANVAVSQEGKALHNRIGQVMSFKVFDSAVLVHDQSPDIDAHQRRLPDTATLSRRNIGIIQSWIEECAQKHAHCESGIASWVPSRLLDVQPTQGPGDARLVEKADIASDSHYAALSHMWGDMTTNPPTRTLTSSFQKMKNGIDLRDLSRNFRDAVTVCRALNIRYIWIDSLCIIQDSDPDWQREAATMHLVYRYAVITIAATSSTSAHDGFLHRNIATIPATTTEYTLGEERCNMVVASRGIDSGGVRFADVDASAWNQRGWTMQERSLSTRIVHFCRNKIYFECRSTLKSEENEPEAHVRRVISMWPRNVFQQAEPARAVEDDKAKASFYYDKWCQCVSQYSLRRFTFGSDKLVAIRSVATEMSIALNDGGEDYIPIAGMWRRNLQRELLWYRGAGRAVRPREYRAPTWSWASMDCKVSFALSGVKGQLQLRAPSETNSPPGIDSFGKESRFQVVDVSETQRPIPRGNIMRVKGLTTKLSGLSRVDDRDHWTAIERYHYPWDGTILNGGTGGSDLFCQCMMDEDGAKADADASSAGNEGLYYFHVTDHYPSGLVLRGVPGGGENGEIRTRRVGVATIFTEGEQMFSGYEFREEDYKTVDIC